LTCDYSSGIASGGKSRRSDTYGASPGRSSCSLVDRIVSQSSTPPVPDRTYLHESDARPYAMVDVTDQIRQPMAAINSSF
jgi:hypothetical protein